LLSQPSAPPTSATVAPEPPAGTSDGLELAAACGPVPFPWPIGDPETAFQPFDGNVDELVDEEARVEWNFWPPTTWWVVEDTETELMIFGLQDIPTIQEPSYSYALFEQVDGDWRAAGWGDCRIQVTAEGFGIATFEIDGENPPDPEGAEFHLLANERACASGKTPVDREVIPVVAETSHAVEVIVLVESPVGDAQTCQGNPAFPLTVQLDAPLGERMIRDGALYPAEDRPWPPPPADPVLSLSTAGDAPSPGTANVVAWDGELYGALLFTSDGWTSEASWFQSFLSEYPTTITGFVTQCASEARCVEECEGAACDLLPRLGAECNMSYTPVLDEKTSMIITFTGNTCTIESVSREIG
jgi:hypothetical protein